MKAALLHDRSVVKVAGDDARKFLNGLITNDTGKVDPVHAAFAALLTPQGKIIADFIVAEAQAADGGGFFLDCPRVLAPTLVQRLNFYKLRARVLIEDLSEILAVMAIWDGSPGNGRYGLCYGDPRLPELGSRCMLPPHRVPEATASLGAEPCAASRSRSPAAGSISFMEMPSRTRRTWINSAASISPRVASSARRWFRASSIAARRAPGWWRCGSTISRRRPARP